MAHIVKNRISETTTTVGTGVLTLSARGGYQRFSAKMVVGDTCWYAVEAVDDSGAFEYGIATYSAANTLARTTVLGSSAGTNRVNFGAGTKRVSMTILAPDEVTASQWLAILGIAGGSLPVDTSDQTHTYLSNVSAFLSAKTLELRTL